MIYRFTLVWLVFIALCACTDSTSAADHYCLNQSLSCAADNHKEALLVLDQPLQMEQPLTFLIRLPKGEVATKAKARLVGANMEMGRIPVQLTLTNRENEFQGTLLIVACTRPDMEWRLEVEVESSHPAQHLVLQWTFSTKHME